MTPTSPIFADDRHEQHRARAFEPLAFLGWKPMRGRFRVVQIELERLVRHRSIATSPPSSGRRLDAAVQHRHRRQTVLFDPADQNGRRFRTQRRVDLVTTSVVSSLGSVSKRTRLTRDTRIFCASYSSRKKR